MKLKLKEGILIQEVAGEKILMTGVKPKPSYGGVTEIQTTMAQYLVDIITGRYDSVEEGLNELNTECQALLDEYSEE